jgi:hypothetical protein
MQFDQLKRREFITPLTGADFELGGVVMNVTPL